MSEPLNIEESGMKVELIWKVLILMCSGFQMIPIRTPAMTTPFALAIGKRRPREADSA